MEVSQDRLWAQLADLGRQPAPIEDVGRAVSEVIGRTVGHDGYYLIWFDPVSGIRGMGFGDRILRDRRRLVENETYDNDLNRYTDLAARRCPVGILGGAGGDERRSIRLHEMLHPAGFTSEIRVVLRTPSTIWGAMVLVRAGRPFNEQDTTRLDSLTSPLITLFRRQPVHRTTRPPPEPPPSAVLLLGPDNVVEAADPSAPTWLADLDGDHDPARTEQLPMALYACANAARAGQPAWTRIRTLAGHWLLVSGTILEPSPGGPVAITLTAATPQQIRPVLIAGHGLTPREAQLVDQLLEGVPVKQIARRLGLSPLTVNDHLKAIYRKTDFHGRDELTAHFATYR